MVKFTCLLNYISNFMTQKKANPAVNYIQESILELKRVTWPTRQQAFKLTIIVLSFCLAAALFVGAVDWLFNTGYAQLLTLAKPQ